jgi:hypothetical protein
MWTNGDSSVGIVRSQTQATEFVFIRDDTFMCKTQMLVYCNTVSMFKIHNCEHDDLSKILSPGMYS